MADETKAISISSCQVAQLHRTTLTIYESETVGEAVVYPAKSMTFSGIQSLKRLRNLINEALPNESEEK